MVGASFHSMPLFLFVLISHDLACWVLVYLGVDDTWKDKATVEVRNLIAAYTNTTSFEPIHQRLSVIPISAWEDEMPVLESIIRETLRMANNATLFRRNLSDGFQAAGKTIDKGVFMAYNIGDVHLNERFYPDPLKFDPDRFNVAREDKYQGNAPFFAWGAGSHSCTGEVHCFSRWILFNVDSGMKVAKVEIKMIVALVLFRYEFKLVDGSGKPTKQAPQPNMNDTHQVCQIPQSSCLTYSTYV
jgi:hypothetical protein